MVSLSPWWLTIGAAGAALVVLVFEASVGLVSAITAASIAAIIGSYLSVRRGGVATSTHSTPPQAARFTHRCDKSQ